jgi:C4-dicarboxylate-specific signal transduction histidine kinase
VSEYRLLDRQGSTVWWRDEGRVMPGPDGRARFVRGFVLDITEQKRAQKLARQQEERLQATSRLITMGEMASTLAHELNQPLAMILTNAEAAQALLAREPADLSEVRDILADIVSADRRAADVIRHLRGLLERGEPQREELLLDDAIHRVLRLIGNEVDDQGVTVNLSLVPDLPSVKADRILIEQVLLNLLNNACEAVAGNTPDERRVSIVTRVVGDDVLVDVTDNGCGLPDPERVFTPFYSTKPGGLGMGLAIVRSILESHGGSVRAESVPVRGTTVTLSLPTNGAAS